MCSLNKKRSPVFELDDEDYFSTGQARGLRVATHEEARAYLRATCPGRARIWDREQCAFVPVD